MHCSHIPFLGLVLIFLAAPALAAEESRATLANRSIDQGDDWMDKGQYDRAIAAYSEALRHDAENARAYNNRGYAWYQKGQKDKAVADYSAALRRQPEYVQALNNRGLALIDLGKVDEAIADFTKSLEINPLELAALLGRALAYKAKKEELKAIRDYDTAIGIFKNNRNTRALVYLLANRGSSWREKGEYDKAVADLNEALRIDPKNTFARNELGRVRLGQKKYDKAIAEFTKAIQADATLKVGYLNRGYAHHKKGELDKALPDLSEAVRLDPRYAYAYYLRANVLFQKGELDMAGKDWDKAIVEYTRSIAANSRDSLTASRLAWLLATCPIERYRDGKRAVKVAAKACELTRWEDRSCLDTLAGAYAEVGQFDKAIKYLSRALELQTPGYFDREAGQQRLELYRKRQAYRDPPLTKPGDPDRSAR
jgi:tetratricopeptide (TPR) repeat protein